VSKIPLLPWRLAGLFHPEWNLALGTAGAIERRDSTERGLVLEGQVISRLGPFDEAPDQVASLSRSDVSSGAVDGATIQRMERCRARGSSWKDVQIGELHLCDLEGAELRGVKINRAIGVSFRDATLHDCEIEDAVMVDLAGARLHGLRLGRSSTVDLTGATLHSCALEGADLRGAVLRRARFVDCAPNPELVSGAELGGARGLSAQTRRQLLRGGARFQGAGWYLLLRRVLPKADALRIERAALGLQAAAVILGLLLCVGALVEVLRPRAVEPVPEPPPPLEREASSWEIQKTRESLAVLRQALQAAHDRMVANGATGSTWPSMDDFQQNTYDIDGDGPGEVREPLVEGGMPDNLLTDSVGSVLPYCNDVPTQETIAGIDNDWHYCELSGRIFACGGYTSLATLDW
jgi:uncharacterized protein YjbI with pentapeptide repeats